MNDTSPFMEEALRERLLAKSGAERLAMASSMFESARRMILASLPPDLSPDQIRSELLARIYPEFTPSER